LAQAFESKTTASEPAHRLPIDYSSCTMSAETEGTGMSKSARKRANKKAREAADAQEEEPAPVPAAKPKAKAAAKESAPEPKAKAAAKAKADAEPKAKAKAKAEPAAAAPKAQPKAEAAQAKPEAKAKAKGKAKTAAAKPAEEEKPKDAILQPIEFDDGAGGEWETSSGLSKKMQRSKERREAKKLEEERAEQEKKEQEIQAAKAKKAAEKAAAAAAVAATPGATKAAKAKAKAEAKAAEPETKDPAPAKDAAPTVANASVTAEAVAKKAEEPKEGEAEKENLHTAIVKVPDMKVARIIGPKGSTMNMIKEKTGIINIDMSSPGDCILTGSSPEAVAMAEVAVNEIIEKGYMSLAYECFAEAQVPCPKSEIANIIGRNGDVIKVIKEQCKVEIDMPKTDKDPKADPGKKVKISVAGESEGVEKAKECINSIAMYGHHEITHPGVEHREMDVEEWQYAFIIGKNGSEMRHIQNNFEVKCNIPRDYSMIQKVLVIGEGHNVERACKYIEKILKEKSEQKSGRDKPEKAEDTWGEEGPIEPWMKGYMYQRR